MLAVAGYKLTVMIGVLRSLGFIVRMWRSGTHFVNRAVASLSPSNVLVMIPGSKREAKEGLGEERVVQGERKWALGTGDLLVDSAESKLLVLVQPQGGSK